MLKYFPTNQAQLALNGILPLSSLKIVTNCNFPPLKKYKSQMNAVTCMYLKCFLMAFSLAVPSYRRTLPF